MILDSDLLFLQYLAIPTLWPFSNNQTRFANQCGDSGTGVAIHTLQRTLDCHAVARNDDNFIVIIANIFSFHSKLAGKVRKEFLRLRLLHILLLTEAVYSSALFTKGQMSLVGCGRRL